MKAEKLITISDNLFEIPPDARKGMLVPARIYASEGMIGEMDQAVFEQITNVALLPGIQKFALCMPDGHSGYGFPIGGVAAMNPDTGVISPGGIGFDINCGIRLVSTNLTLPEVAPKLDRLIQGLFQAVPSGVGNEGILHLSRSKLDQAVSEGVRWAVKNGWGEPDDLLNTEDGGRIGGSDPDEVSDRAFQRGKNQIGTLGSGNHFLEIQVAKKENIFDPELASRMGIVMEDQIVVMIHTGSRGYGHQIATDYLQRFTSVMRSRYGLSMPDRELVCVPFLSEEGQAYYRAMNCAINFAFLNRQIIMHRVREVFMKVFEKSPASLGMRLIYDVCHNTAKLERHIVDGRERELLVHRKGATRAFPGDRRELADQFRYTGQPVIIGGSMETGSYLLAGVPSSAETFFTTAHGSGRLMSRTQAKRQFNGREIQRRMREHGIIVQTASLSGLAEEAGPAYKNIDEVVGVTQAAGLSRVVAKLVPIGNIKG